MINYTHTIYDLPRKNDSPYIIKYSLTRRKRYVSNRTFFTRNESKTQSKMTYGMHLHSIGTINYEFRPTGVSNRTRKLLLPRNTHQRDLRRLTTYTTAHAVAASLTRLQLTRYLSAHRTIFPQHKYTLGTDSLRTFEICDISVVTLSSNSCSSGPEPTSNTERNEALWIYSAVTFLTKTQKYVFPTTRWGT